MEKRVITPWKTNYVGNTSTDQSVTINVFSFNKEKLNERHFFDIKELLFDKLNKTQIHWIEIDGIHDTAIAKSIAKSVGIHGLTLEDILNAKQRPKIEVHDDYIYVSLKTIEFNASKETFSKEQISIILKDGLVILFSESPNDIFERIKVQLTNKESLIRNNEADLLFYCLIDIIIDSYFIIIEKLDDEISNIENGLSQENINIVDDVYWLKKELLYLKKAIYPISDILKNLIATNNHLLSKDVLFYFQDTRDHCTQINEAVGLNLELVSSFYDHYLSNINKKTNEVMIFLTIFSTIFIPLTFITGIYGMNFKNMPELEYKYAYHLTLLVLATTGIGIYKYFKRKKWFGD
ncbi:magnesium/cobalt transporter CorA [Halobacteriovorax sp. GFR7]|uniref:magnesium/cobalt transporter CorA n=1 Tax=unclassified Halobacteriovorax TaxID=2639665 RepID=UPI003D95F3AC